MAPLWQAILTRCAAGALALLIAGPVFATELTDAVKARDAGRVMHLLGAGADPNQRSPYDGPLHVAARLGLAEIAIGLIDAGADIELPGFGGARPLHAATLAEQGEVVSLLLRRGAKVDALDNMERTPLQSFVSGDAKDLSILKELLTSGADPNLLDGAAGMHALDHAAIHGRAEVAKLLIAFGADMNASNNQRGQTPLHFAITYCLNTSRIQMDMVRVLIANGADVNAPNSSGQSPLGYARHYAPNAGLLHSLLIEAGAR
jgi:ankyrin repeat protein